MRIKEDQIGWMRSALESTAVGRDILIGLTLIKKKFLPPNAMSLVLDGKISY